MKLGRTFRWVEGFVIAFTISVAVKAKYFTLTPQENFLVTNAVFVRGYLSYSRGFVAASDFVQGFSLEVDDTYIQVTAAGVWVGPLPAEGTHVMMVSTTGYTRDVLIVNMDTKREYFSVPHHVYFPANRSYFVRVPGRASGTVVVPDLIFSGFDSFDVIQRHSWLWRYINGFYCVQSWETGEEAPPLLFP